MKLENPVLMGKIGAAHGIRGEVRVKSFTDDPMALGDYGSLYSVDGRKFKITNLRFSKTVVVTKFKGVNSRDDAEKLNGTELFIDRASLPDDTEEDEFYVTDMIGMDVLDESGAVLGKIMAVPDFGAGDLLEIMPTAGANLSGKADKSWYLQFTLENVPNVDLENRHITIRLPEETVIEDEARGD